MILGRWWKCQLGLNPSGYGPMGVCFSGSRGNGACWWLRHGHTSVGYEYETFHCVILTCYQEEPWTVGMQGLLFVPGQAEASEQLGHCHWNLAGQVQEQRTWTMACRIGRSGLKAVLWWERNFETEILQILAMLGKLCRQAQRGITKF